MHRIGIDFKATLPQTILGLVGGVIVFRYLIRPTNPFGQQTPGADNSASNGNGQTAIQHAPQTIGQTSASPFASSTIRIRQLDSPNALDEIGRGRTVLLITRGYPAEQAELARAAFAKAVSTLSVRAQDMQFFDINDTAAYIPATTLMTRLGIAHDKPFVMILDRFITTEDKYLSPNPEVPSTTDIVKFVDDFMSGRLSPARMGQARPHGDRSATCPSLVEVVTDSFNDLVLDPHADVLLECYTRRCDACKAFAPRYRMLASLCARHCGDPLPSRGQTGQGRPPFILRIAAMDILDNDRDPTWLPEKWTPCMRLFPATGSATVPKQSVLLQHTVDAAQGEDEAQGQGHGKTATSASGTKVYLPTLPELLSFLAEHTDGRLVLTPQLRSDAEALEEQAVALENAYDATLRYMQLWHSYNSLVEDQTAAAIEAGEKEGSARMTELAGARRAADQLRALIIASYKYLVEEAGGSIDGDAAVSTSLEYLDAVADHVARNAISQVVSDAMEAETQAFPDTVEKAP